MNLLWCRNNQDKSKLDASVKREQTGYYRSKIEDADLYERLKKKYEYYISKEMLEMCAHEYDTQVNEGMNTCIARYAPKTRTYSKSVSLQTRVMIAVCIFLVGYHYFWTKVMDEGESE